MPLHLMRQRPSSTWSELTVSNDLADRQLALWDILRALFLFKSDTRMAAERNANLTPTAELSCFHPATPKKASQGRRVISYKCFSWLVDCKHC